jgi:hypothetical protein
MIEPKQHNESTGVSSESSKKKKKEEHLAMECYYYLRDAKRGG